MSNKLVPIPREDLPKLRDLFKNEWPKFYTGYHTIDNYFKWFKKDPEISNIEIYSLNGDWSDGTFLILDNFQLLINTCSDDHGKIPQMLSLVDWNKEWDICAYLSKIRNDVENFINSNNLEITSFRTETYWFYLPKEEALKYEVRIPDGFMLKQLTESDAEFINSLWPHHKDGTSFFLQRLIKYNPSFGIYNNSNELVGWIMRSQIGTLGILHVVDEYKRRGLGSLLVMTLAKTLAEMGEDSCATVITSNTPSLNMFNKLGFKPLDKYYWAENVRFANK